MPDKRCDPRQTGQTFFSVSQILPHTVAVESIRSRCNKRPRRSFFSYQLSIQLYIMSNTSGNSKKKTRSRNIKRNFVLLRNDDELRVPRTSTLKNLCDSGRVRDIEFSNNATSHHIGEILSNSFPNFLSREEFAR